MSKNNLEVDLRGKLADIMKYKAAELEQQKTTKCCRDFMGALKNASGIGLVAEIKRASPSLGEINMSEKVEERARAYELAGADAISVVTDSRFFNGDISFLRRIRAAVGLPILRKDFIFDEYQIYEAKLFGADAILLIASILTLEKLQELIFLARELGLDCLVEVHTKEDLAKTLKTKAEIIGINARNLSTFEVDLQNILNLAPLVPKNKILVAESGIVSADDVKQLKNVGVKSILVGTVLMQAVDVIKKIKELRLQ